MSESMRLDYHRGRPDNQQSGRPVAKYVLILHSCIKSELEKRTSRFKVSFYSVALIESTSLAWMELLLINLGSQKHWRHTKRASVGITKLSMIVLSCRTSMRLRICEAKVSSMNQSLGGGTSDVGRTAVGRTDAAVAVWYRAISFSFFSKPHFL